VPEFNHKPGMRAARGRQGHAKRRLVERFCADEHLLRAARQAAVHRPHSSYSHAQDSCRNATAGEGDADGLCAFGFTRLEVEGWPRP